MKYKVFVDGLEGTTGLKINERLTTHNYIEVLKIDPEKRKDINERRKLLNEADIAFLCLPDDAAKESVSLIENDKTRVIDASTAHRVNPDWAYGIPELSFSHREKITASKRVAVAGCYATGFNVALYPLVSQGIVPADYPVTCHAISGCSGGGKKLIAKYEDPETAAAFEGPQLYSLGLKHKHIPEMQTISGLKYSPIFSPIVDRYYKGMTVAIPLLPRLLSKNIGLKDIHAFLSDYYKGEHFVKVMPIDAINSFNNGFLGPIGCNDSNNLELYVFGNEDQVMLISRLDNLGKGSSGAAVQNMNIMLGLYEGESLD